MPRVSVTFDCKNAEIAASDTGGGQVSVNAGDAWLDEIIDSIGREAILDEIGEDACRDHFGIEGGE